jgi:DNA-binding NtrC family response regulator
MLYRTLLQVNADVAEMKTVLRHLLAMSMEFRADNANDASLAVTKPSSNDALPTLNMVELERMAIDAAMRKANGNRREAANILGISTRTLYRKLDEFGIE